MTLIEIMIVVGLIGVISVIAVPMFAGALANFKLSGDARSVSNATAGAKLRAAATSVASGYMSTWGPRRIAFKLLTRPAQSVVGLRKAGRQHSLRG